MCHKHHISSPAVLITFIITLLVSGSDEFSFTTTPLEERLQKITTNTLDLNEEGQALFMGNCEKQYTALRKRVYQLSSPQGPRHGVRRAAGSAFVLVS